MEKMESICDESAFGYFDFCEGRRLERADEVAVGKEPSRRRASFYIFVDILLCPERWNKKNERLRSVVRMRKKHLHVPYREIR